MSQIIKIISKIIGVFLEILHIIGGILIIALLYIFYNESDYILINQINEVYFILFVVTIITIVPFWVDNQMKLFIAKILKEDNIE